MEGSTRAIERKVITALFCDVVGSTELAERLDPEDIDRIMSTYHRLARRRIEANGGTVEKFIGDAVVGLFGATAIHEDDPTRAIQSALAIIRELAASDLGLEVRIGIQTGEAVVRVDDERTAEESRAIGDILNTASRLQNVAPAGAIVVGDPTHRRAAAEFDWDDLGQVELKGKAQPLQIWRPTAKRQAAPSLTDEEATPFLGRQSELSVLVGAFERAANVPNIQLVTVLAEPGMGKSRLLRELGRRLLAERDGRVSWLRGRCLPYGDGVSFWALGEIVKAHAGILETDDEGSLAAKLDQALTEPDPQIRSWLRERLAPLVGLHTDAAPPEQNELFSAWTRFVVSLADDGPLVLVVEDLHWADAALVDFLIHLADSADRVPLAVLVTARPEVSERHPAWLERASKSTLIELTSLGDDEIRTLVESTLANASEAFIATVLGRASGSPLYAEQLAALARDRRLTGENAAFDETQIPPTVHALLAARVDSLPRELKPVLLDASVIGRIFWSGAVATLEGRAGEDAEPALADLARRALTREQSPSSMEGEAEYGFWHALLRDVAYSFLPRAARLAKHRAAAVWITERTRDRLASLAEIVADHLQRALDLASAIGAEDELPSIRSDLASALIAAADHTIRIEPTRAIGQLKEAIALMDANDERQSRALTTLGAAHLARSEIQDAVDVLEAAARWHLDHGDEVAAAELATQRARALGGAGRQPEALAVLEVARPILEAHPGLGLVEFRADHAIRLCRQDMFTEAIPAADKALQMAEELGLPRPYRAVLARGTAVSLSGDVAGERDILESIDLAVAAGDNRFALVALGYRANIMIERNHASVALAAFDDAITFARRYGLSDQNVSGSRLDALEISGHWDELIEEGAAMRADALARGDSFSALMIRLQVTLIALQRGTVPDMHEDFMAAAESVGMPPSLGGGLTAAICLGRGDYSAAHATVEAAVQRVPDGSWILSAVELVTTALALGDVDLARSVLAKAFPDDDKSTRGFLTKLTTALVREAEGELAEAFHHFAAVQSFFEARGWPGTRVIALFGAGRCGVALGNVSDGLELLREAREIALDLKAAPILGEIEAAIQGAETDSRALAAAPE